MEDILDRKVTDLTVFESMKYAYLVSMSSKITMNLADFCEATGQDRRKVYALLKSRYYPEKLLSGGYASLKQRKSPIFITEEVLKWLR